MNNNQKKQLATILTTLASIILSALIAGLVKDELQLGLLLGISLFAFPVPLYALAIYILKKEQKYDRNNLQ